MSSSGLLEPQRLRPRARRIHCFRLGIASRNEMKTRRHLILLFATMLLLGGSIWLAWPTRGTRQSVKLTRQMNSNMQSSNAVAFCVTNIGPRAILLTDVIVEVGSPSGWQPVSHTVPTHPQRLAPGDTKDLVASVPSAVGPCRLRVAYGTDVKGPMLLVAKAVYSISHFHLTGQGFGVMAGSNFCVSV